MERGEYIPFRDSLFDICSDIQRKAKSGGKNGDEHVWIPPWPMRDHSRATQVAVSRLVASGALETAWYARAEAWQCEAFRAVREPARGANCFYIVRDMDAIRRWAAERPALTQSSARRYLSESRASSRAAA
jgi:hypothetical protein